MRRLLFACCLALPLASCFDVHEEVWVGADGSGRMRFDYTFPSEALLVVGGEDGLRQEVARFFNAEPDLHLDELTLTSRGADLDLTLRASTPSMLSLLDLRESEAFRNLPPSAADLAGAFEVKIRGLSIEARRRVDLQRTLGLATLAIGAEQRSSRQVRYTFHLPAPAREHNATRVEDGGRTLVWEYTLGQALAKPVVTEFKSRIPLPWWAWASVALLILLPVAAVFSWRRRRRARARAKAVEAL